ncbi:MAG: IPT/TIG domain-containing protein, partial [Acidimicrobiales bacterium]
MGPRQALQSSRIDSDGTTWPIAGLPTQEREREDMTTRRGIGRALASGTGARERITRNASLRTATHGIAVAALGAITLVGGLVGFGVTPAWASALPTVTSVAPPFGGPAGGTVVTVNGTGLTGATAVDFGADPGTNVTVNSVNSLT